MDDMNNELAGFQGTTLWCHPGQAPQGVCHSHEDTGLDTQQEHQIADIEADQQTVSLMHSRVALSTVRNGSTSLTKAAMLMGYEPSSNANKR